MDYFTIEIDLIINDLKIESDGMSRVINTVRNEKLRIPNDDFLVAVEEELNGNEEDEIRSFVNSTIDEYISKAKVDLLPSMTTDMYDENWNDAVVVEYKTYVERMED